MMSHVVWNWAMWDFNSVLGFCFMCVKTDFFFKKYCDRKSEDVFTCRRCQNDDVLCTKAQKAQVFLSFWYTEIEINRRKKEHERLFNYWEDPLDDWRQSRRCSGRQGGQVRWKEGTGPDMKWEGGGDSKWWMQTDQRLWVNHHRKETKLHYLC